MLGGCFYNIWVSCFLVCKYGWEIGFYGIDMIIEGKDIFWIRIGNI